MVSSFSSTEAECSVKVESVTLRCMDGRSVVRLRLLAAT